MIHRINIHIMYKEKRFSWFIVVSGQIFRNLHSSNQQKVNIGYQTGIAPLHTALLSYMYFWRTLYKYGRISHQRNFMLYVYAELWFMRPPRLKMVHCCIVFSDHNFFWFFTFSVKNRFSNFYDDTEKYQRGEKGVERPKIPLYYFFHYGGGGGGNFSSSSPTILGTQYSKSFGF